MSEMVERGIDGLIANFKARIEAHSAAFGVVQTFEQTKVECPSRDTFRPMVVAAIEAMRVPTAEMLFVGSNEEAGFTERNLLQSWYLMIDEALK